MNTCCRCGKPLRDTETIMMVRHKGERAAAHIKCAVYDKSSIRTAQAITNESGEPVWSPTAFGYKNEEN